MEDMKTNFLAGVSILQNDVETLIRDSERLEVITEYAKNSKFIDRNTLLILLGFIPESEK